MRIVHPQNAKKWKKKNTVIFSCCARPAWLVSVEQKIYFEELCWSLFSLQLQLMRHLKECKSTTKADLMLYIPNLLKPYISFMWRGTGQVIPFSSLQKTWNKVQLSRPLFWCFCVLFFEAWQTQHQSPFVVIAWKTATGTFSSELLLLCSAEQSKSYRVVT